VPRLRDVLYRFRPAGTPGRASATGVPADHGVGPADELESLFAQLAPVERACEELLESARQGAAAVRADAATAAGRALARARDRLEAERVSAAGKARGRRDQESADSMRAAASEVARLRRRTDDVLPRQLERVVASVRSLLDSGEAATAGRSPT